MYTKEHDPDMDQWGILDPDGDFICYINSSMVADALLSHLNRG